jgi:predicted DNA binding CopG/RHH family protein
MSRRQSRSKDKRVAFMDEEERALITSIEDADARGELRPVKHQKEIIAQAQAGARRWMETERKEARVNIRLRPSVLAAFKARAEREGLPYQVVLASLAYRYAYPEPATPPTVAAESPKLEGHIRREIAQRVFLSGKHGDEYKAIFNLVRLMSRDPKRDAQEVAMLERMLERRLEAPPKEIHRPGRKIVL